MAETTEKSNEKPKEESNEKPNEKPKEESKEEEEEINIDCSTTLNNKVLIISVTLDGKIVANLYDLADPPPPEPDASNPSPAPPSDTSHSFESSAPPPSDTAHSFESSTPPSDTSHSDDATSTPPSDTSHSDDATSKSPNKKEDTSPDKSEPKPADRNALLQKVLSEIMAGETNPNWIPRVFWLKQQKKGKYNIVLHEQSVLELMTGSKVSDSPAKGPLSKMACAGLDPNNHTDVLSLLLGFPIVPPDRYRDQLIGDIIKSVNPIKSIPEGKDLPQLQEHSRTKLESIKKLCDKLLASSKKGNEFENVTKKINKLITPKKKESSGGGKRKRTRKRYK